MLYYLFQEVWSLMGLLALSTSLLYCTNCRNCFSEMLFVDIRNWKCFVPYWWPCRCHRSGKHEAESQLNLWPKWFQMVVCISRSDKIMDNFYFFFFEYIDFATSLLGPRVNIVISVTLPMFYPCQSGVPWHRAGQGIHLQLRSLLKEPRAAAWCFASLCFASALIPLFKFEFISVFTCIQTESKLLISFIFLARSTFFSCGVTPDHCLISDLV